MATTLNREAYRKALQEDIDWIKKVPRTLERDHVLALLEYEHEHCVFKQLEAWERLKIRARSVVFDSEHWEMGINQKLIDELKAALIQLERAGE